MTTQREKVRFENNRGETLAGLLELPPGEVAGYALFAHCFTCGKDLRSASRIVRTLAAQGIATLRFDFTGLGNSDGDFANTNFSSNLEDLQCAADFLGRAYAAPALLIGHSLGGAAVLGVADELPSVQAVVTIGAPSDPGHVAHLFDDLTETIEEEGAAQVNLAGRQFRIRRQFLDDIREQSLRHRVGKLRRPLLIFHSPHDQVVSIDEAAKIYGMARHPKSFVSLDKADHLLSAAADAEYLADTLAAWVKRYLQGARSAPQAESVAAGQVRVTEADRLFTRRVETDSHHWLADEPTNKGGRDLGPDPYEHLLAALGTCTSMTIRMYANHKKWPVDDIQVTLSHSKEHFTDCDESVQGSGGTQGKIDVLRRAVMIDAPTLSAAQHDRLLEIADRCPVHKTLNSPMRIVTRAVTAGGD